MKINDKLKYPKIKCVDKELISDIGCWLGVKHNILKEFGKVLVNIGFDVNDEVVLCKYNKSLFTFTYIVNGCNPYKKNTICLDCGYIDNDPMILVTTGTRKTKDRVVYKCGRDKKNKIDNKFIIKLIDKDLSSKVSYRRIIEEDYDSFIVNYNNEYSLNIRIEKSSSGLLSDYESVYLKNNRFKNEEKLINYLVNLCEPFNIDSIYKDVVLICFKDVSLYSRFLLSINKFDSLNNKDMVLGKIDIRDGVVMDRELENVSDCKKLVRTISSKGGNYDR